jgi:hypothetical protein
MGQSCGGGLAVQQAVEDTRVTALGVWNSGAGLGARGSAAAIPLDDIKGPVLVITGSEKLDIAFASGKSTFERINQAPVFYAWRDDLQHIGTYGAANGGELGQIAWKWLEWTTRGDPSAAKTFKGAACGLCKDAAWHVMKKKIDGQDRGSANARIFEPGAAPR